MIAMELQCVHCESTFMANGSRGRTPRYCSARCRKAASRSRSKMEYRKFPSAMLEAARWTRADGKRPITPAGMPASSTNDATWSNFDDVQSGSGDGFGFMLGDGFACLDLDNCFSSEGRLKTVAAAIVSDNPGAFIERSVSGRGLHIFGLLPPGRGRRMSGVEVYSTARFIRTTGDVYQSGGLSKLVF